MLSIHEILSQWSKPRCAFIKNGSTILRPALTFRREHEINLSDIFVACEDLENPSIFLVTFTLAHNFLLSTGRTILYAHSVQTFRPTVYKSLEH